MKTKRTFAALTSIFLFCHMLLPFPGNASEIDFVQSSKAFSHFSIPAEMGSVESLFQGKTDRFVTLIQDAHANPEAQKNIRLLIDYLKSEYSVSLIGLEGAPMEIDAQFFKSFPDSEKLMRMVRNYELAGELPGGLGAAILEKSEAEYFGLEDWRLYQAGYEFYIRAAEKQKSLLGKYHEETLKLREEKKLKYSPELFEADQAFEAFQDDPHQFLKSLQAFANIQSPKNESDLELLYTKFHSDAENPEIERELKRTMDLLESSLKAKETDKSWDSVIREFSVEKQAFETSQSAAGDFVLWMYDFCLKNKLKVTFPDALIQLASDYRKLLTLRGGKVFDEFRVYAEGVFQAALLSPELKELHKKSQKLLLIKKLVSLELTINDWKTVKENGLIDDPAFANSVAFYENALSRDLQFWECWKDMALTGSDVKNSVLVVGGFHAEGLANHLREAGISYAIVTTMTIRRIC